MTADPRQVTNNFNGRLQKILQGCFYEWFFTDRLSDQEVIEKYFATDFSALIDGVELDRHVFEQRVHRMRQEAIVERQEFVEMIEQDNKLFSMHTVEGKSLLSGQQFATRVIALFVFNDEKIERVYVNSATKGDPRDADIASRS